MDPSQRPEHWWGQDPHVVACPQCGCPVQGAHLGMSKHLTTVHPRTDRNPA